MNGGYLVDLMSVVLLISAFVLLLNAKSRDITRYLRGKLGGISFLIIVFVIVFMLGFFIPTLSVVAFIVSFILLLLGFNLNKKVEVRRAVRIFRSRLEKGKLGPKIKEIKKEKGEIEELKAKLEKEKQAAEEETKAIESRRKEEKKKLEKEFERLKLLGKASPKQTFKKSLNKKAKKPVSKTRKKPVKKPAKRKTSFRKIK